jgi:hypothetical protein
MNCDDNMSLDNLVLLLLVERGVGMVIGRLGAHCPAVSSPVGFWA